MKASDLFVKQLEEEGVKYVFGLPGEENLEFLESLRKSKIKLVVTRHEQNAAFMAATYGRLTGRAGVCFSTLGPGATNLVTGIAHAQLIGAPIVSISGQKAIRDNWQARFQLVDVVSIMRPITKKSTTIIDPNMVPTLVREAFTIAENERPGAVHIEFPEDVAELKSNAKVQKRGYNRRPGPDKKAIQASAKLINSAKKPLVLIGSGANRKRITKRLTNFIHKTGIFVVHTQMGKGVISDNSKNSLYATGIHKKDYVNCGIGAADLIICIGYNPSEYPPYLWNEFLNKKIVNIDFVQGDVDRYYNPNVELTGDIGHILEALQPLVKKRNYPFFEKTKKFIEEHMNKKYSEGFPLSPPHIVNEVSNNLSKTDIIALDNGIYKLWFSRLYKTYNANTFLIDNTFATMGAGLAVAMMAKLLNPHNKVLAVVGDGGFMMNSQEIETALRNKIKIVVLILNDNAFGFIKWKQKNMKLKKYALDYTNPDFVKYAESYGAIGRKLKKGEKLSDLLKWAFNQKKITIIECPIDYNLNYEVFSKELENLVCRI